VGRAAAGAAPLLFPGRAPQCTAHVRLGKFGDFADFAPPAAIGELHPLQCPSRPFASSPPHARRIIDTFLCFSLRLTPVPFHHFYVRGDCKTHHVSRPRPGRRRIDQCPKRTIALAAIPGKGPRPALPMDARRVWCDGGTGALTPVRCAGDGPMMVELEWFVGWFPRVCRERRVMLPSL
jgi:hypothetical protein